VVERLLRQRGGERHGEIRACEADVDREAGFAEHRDHLVVVGEDERLEDADAVRGRDLAQMSEQDGAEPSPLVAFGDRERHLSGLPPRRTVRGVPNDASFRARHRDQPEVALSAKCRS
jgi:hypothetical protein